MTTTEDPRSRLAPTRRVPRTPRALLAAGLVGLAGAILGALSPAGLVAQSAPDPAEILRRVDANLTFETAWTRSRMTIHYRGGDVRTLEFEAWAEGEERSFIEFVAPARDAGSKFLRLDDVMWYYLPRVGKSVRIQGHMLRQGMMGSDFSLGDASENPSLVDDYRAVIEADSTLDGRPVRVLHLTAKSDDVSYASRRVWVDTERWVPLREERYARGGRLLVTTSLGDVRRVDGRWYPFRIEMDNALQTDTRTVLETLELRLNIDVPERYFTLRNLERGG
ncbi:MAG: outer membrane lipoprotein-sorting protein [Longimicrobiales bacterium]